MERVRFGTYDFLPSTGELRRDGRVIKLQAQPARVLAALVERPGQVVGREMLQREVWGEGTHVDFERGLNFCIAQVRSAPGDSADHPRYIETVPKQGYRFIAPILPEPIDDDDHRRWARVGPRYAVKPATCDPSSGPSRREQRP